jgi:ribonucleoside-diphosphate reductase alpha chain
LGLCFLTQGDSSGDWQNSVEWTTRQVRLPHPSLTEPVCVSVEAPKGWSEVAVEVTANKYLHRASASVLKETSIRSMIERVVDTIRTFGEEQNYFASPSDAQVFANQLGEILVQQKAAFNSPVWFNCGLYQKYGAQSFSENYHYDFNSQSVVETQNSFERPQSSACFIQSVGDDLLSIYDLVKKEAKIFKYGSGTGSNFSRLRSKGEPLSGGGSSSGLMAFLGVLDRSAGATKSGGITRRAAKMVCLDVDHPEIEDFIEWKVKEEEKARVLVRAGFSSGLDGEAYASVSGQNSNNSVRVTDEFMQLVLDKKIWSLRQRVSGEVARSVSADLLFNKICEAAWKCADPGIQFHDTIQRWHTCAADGEIRATNPCSEYMFLDDSACNLSSLNLVKFFDPTGELQVSQLSEAVRVLIVAQEILVGFSSYPTRSIAENSNRFRPLGLGITNLGGLFMLLGIGYGEPLSQDWARGLMALIHGVALNTSCELAESLGAFAGYAENEQNYLKVIDQHSSHIGEVKNSQVPEGFREAVEEIWRDLRSKVVSSGLRNSQLTAIAPTGTISLLMDCETTGVEPEYSFSKVKFLVGGGEIQGTLSHLTRALQRLGYEPSVVETLERQAMENGDLSGADELLEEHKSIFKVAQSSQVEGRISWQQHLNVMQALQPFVSGAISKTVNLPAEATPQDIYEIYFSAWKRGLKSIAVYRDGSKGVQPLKATAEAEFCTACD